MLLLVVACHFPSAQAQSVLPTPATFYITITDSTSVAYIDTMSMPGQSFPVFTDPSINTFITPYHITSFTHPFSTSKYLSLRQIYKVSCNSPLLASQLKSNYPALFPYYEFISTPEVLTSYTPNDWQPYFSYLDYIGAREAWAKTKGDPNVIIGITDTYFDMHNPDFAGKVVRLKQTKPGDEHGTSVAGLAACATDNDIIAPSIGFNCRLDLEQGLTDSPMLAMSERPGRRVLNGSWHDGGPSAALDIPGHLVEQGVYNNIYENGTLACFAAGNGYSSGCIDPRHFIYPASLNHNFATTGVGHITPTYGADSLAQKDVHAYNIHDTEFTTQNNVRVDICAPYVALSTLGYDSSDSSKHTNNMWETSAASPLTAGAAALVFSYKPCLSPYQAEYILKKSAKDIYGVTFNQQYQFGPSRFTGRLGAGALNVDTALLIADTFECNDPSTQTLYIEGVKASHICAPGVAVGVSNPQLEVIVKNGTPGYTYTWEPLGGNTTILNSYAIPNPQIITDTGTGIAFYRVTVYDNSEIQQVASREFRIQLHTTLTSDLAMRDSYVDMLDEPNSQYDVNHDMYDIWHSPDIWNRDSADGNRVHQDPEYFSSGNPNYIYARIRNVGCAANLPDQATLQVYWTLASTGEQWQDDWDGTTQVASSGPPLLPVIPAGKHITDGSPTFPVSIPVLQPGDSVILPPIPWQPTRPQDFADTPSTVDVCILGRILESNLPNSGITSIEVPRSATNINNNNNIATRNFAVVNLGRACANCRTSGNATRVTRRVYIASSESADKIFTVQMLAQKDIERHLAGDISKYAYVSLSLGSLYDRWQAAGGRGNFATANAETKTVTYDPASSLRLEGINLHAGEHFPVDIAFTLRNGVEIPYPIKDFNLCLRQLINEGKGDEVYGAVVYNINIAATAGGRQRGAQQTTGTGIKLQTSPFYTAYPNPVSGTLNIRFSGSSRSIASILVTDITGKVVFSRENVTMLPKSIYGVKMGQFVPGTYFVHITDTSGNVSVQKISKE